MQLEFRETRLTDHKSISEHAAAALSSGSLRMSVCLHDSCVVGHCVGNSTTGEIVGLSVQPDYQGQGIGKRLLSLVVGWLRAAGAERIWLDAPADPALRAYGFYRALGWRATGEQTQNGSFAGEILELRTDTAI
jgi:ribosomal protein S18 acetylase RimI-like enzyme